MHLSDGRAEPFYRDELATLYHADSTRLEFLADGSVDLAITSPPYNLAVEYEGYRDDVPYLAYLEWVEQWAAALFRVSASGGRACINVPLDTNKAGASWLNGCPSALGGGVIGLFNEICSAWPSMPGDVTIPAAGGASLSNDLFLVAARGKRKRGQGQSFSSQ